VKPEKRKEKVVAAFGLAAGQAGLLISAAEFGVDRGLLNVETVFHFLEKPWNYDEVIDGWLEAATAPGGVLDAVGGVTDV